jgi:broad specificity phosphatase PhoE
VRRSASSTRVDALSIVRSRAVRATATASTRCGASLGEVAREFEGGRVLVIAHSAQRWALRHLLEGIPLEELVDAPFEWQEGWEYVVPPAVE